jgi:nucleotide-binding universal stress UspA family protein
MLEQILVPLDGSSLAECVLPHVTALAAWSGAVVTLLRVLEQEESDGTDSLVDPIGWQLARAEAEAYLQEVSDRLAVKGARAETVTLTGEPAERVTSFAGEHDFGLIVLSSHGRSGLSGWNVSSVVQKIILRAYRSVMIVRAYQPVTAIDDTVLYQRILLPLDGSQRAECVLPIATSLAEGSGGTLVLVHAVREPEMPRRMRPTREDMALVERLIERNRGEAQAYLKGLQRRLRATVETRVLVSGDVTTTLHESAETENVDLVMLAAHGYSGAPRRAYGSVATSFIAYGRTPLFIMQDIGEHEGSPSGAEQVVGSPKGR